jgi:hypothetical protein
MFPLFLCPSNSLQKINAAFLLTENQQISVGVHIWPPRLAGTEARPTMRFCKICLGRYTRKLLQNLHWAKNVILSAGKNLPF